MRVKDLLFVLSVRKLLVVAKGCCTFNQEWRRLKFRSKEPCDMCAQGIPKLHIIM